MEARAVKKYVRISRRKIWRIAKECVGNSVEEVKGKLSFLPQKSARVLLSTICSAEGNFLFANPNENTEKLLIESILVDKGPSMKRIIYRARGRADRIEKKSSHVTVILKNNLKK